MIVGKCSVVNRPWGQATPHAGEFRTTYTADESVKYSVGVVEITQVADVCLINVVEVNCTLKVTVDKGISVAKVE
jgi:hypothetical protein